MAIDQQDQMKAKATKEDRGDVQISIRKVRDRVMVAQLMIKKIKDRALADQLMNKRVKVLRVAAQIRERALVAQIKERALAAQIREIAQVAQIRVRMVRVNKEAVQNLMKTSLALKELINSWKILQRNAKKRNWSACKSSLTLSSNCKVIVSSLNRLARTLILHVKI